MAINDVKKYHRNQKMLASCCPAPDLEFSCDVVCSSVHCFEESSGEENLDEALEVVIEEEGKEMIINK